MTEKMVGVKFLLRNAPCGFIGAVMPEHSAQELFRRFMNKEHSPIGSYQLNVGGWAVNLADVAGMHTYSLDSGPQPFQGPQGQMPFPSNLSGL